MVSDEDIEKLLETLEEIPILQFACKRVGVARATVYRWLESDEAFRKKYNKALKTGRKNMTDHAESKLFKLIDEKNLGAIKYFLDANDRRYYKPRKPMSGDPYYRGITAITFTSDAKVIPAPGADDILGK